jgi:hypothetical protein
MVILNGHFRRLEAEPNIGGRAAIALTATSYKERTVPALTVSVFAERAHKISPSTVDSVPLHLR